MTFAKIIATIAGAFGLVIGAFGGRIAGRIKGKAEGRKEAVADAIIETQKRVEKGREAVSRGRGADPDSRVQRNDDRWN
jgi:hypothetical protein